MKDVERRSSFSKRVLKRIQEKTNGRMIKEKFPDPKIRVFRRIGSLSDQQDYLKFKRKKKDRIKENILVS